VLEAFGVEMLNQMDETLTIAEAAGLLGISERSLRRHLADPRNAAVTRRETRQTRTGSRIATVLIASELGRIREAFSMESAPGTPPGEHRRERGGKAGTEHGESPPLPPFQDALIAELRGQVEAKDREMRERLADQAETIADLRRTKDALIERLSESEARLALVLAATDRLQIAAQETEQLSETEDREISTDTFKKEKERPKRSIWRWWDRGTRD
jgi:hypothetical protein